MNAAQLDHTAKVLAEMLTFKQPSDAVLSAYFREHKKLGRQDRHEIAETAFAALRHYQKISTALRRPHAQPRKAALAALILGRSTNISQIKDLLDEEETEFLGNLKARKTEFSDGLNTAAELPQWLVEQLQQHWSEEEILAFGRSINQPAPLDIRVNTLKGKRDKVLPLLQAESADAEVTPYSPWGIRLKNKIALNKHELFLDGTLEVQDEGSQLLALLVGAKRGEIIVDFCAGAGGKTLAVGAQMANKGRIYAFDIAEKQRLDPIIRHLVEHDGQLSRYELAAFIAWRATCITGRGADYRAHEADIAWLYNFLACDDPDDPNPQATYEDLLEVSALPLRQTPAWQPLDTGSSKTGLQLCRHLEALRQLDVTYRKVLLDAIEGYYRRREKVTLPQAYLRYALQQALS